MYLDASVISRSHISLPDGSLRFSVAANFPLLIETLRHFSNPNVTNSLPLVLLLIDILLTFKAFKRHLGGLRHPKQDARPIIYLQYNGRCAPMLYLWGTSCAVLNFILNHAFLYYDPYVASIRV